METVIVENQMEKKMENEMETSCTRNLKPSILNPFEKTCRGSYRVCVYVYTNAYSKGIQIGICAADAPPTTVAEEIFRQPDQR